MLFYAKSYSIVLKKSSDIISMLKACTMMLHHMIPSAYNNLVFIISLNSFDSPWQVGNQEEKLAEGIKLYALSTPATSKRSILSDLVTV